MLLALSALLVAASTLASPIIRDGRAPFNLTNAYLDSSTGPFRTGDAHKTTLTGPAKDSDSNRIADAKDPSGARGSAQLPRESCRVMYAQKNDLLSQKDGLLAQQSVDLATSKTQLAATHQIKNDLLVEKDITCSLILADKNEELAALKGQLSAVQQSIATITTDRDEGYACAATIGDALEKTHAEYGEKVVSLKTRAIDVERNSATLQAMGQQ